MIRFPTATLRTFQDEPSWLEARRESIGSSDGPALWGAVPGTDLDVIADKLGLAPPFEATDAMETGKRVEGFLVSWLGEQLGKSVVPIRQSIAKSERWPFMSASPDGIVLGDDGQPEALIEAKFCRFLYEWNAAEKRWPTIYWDKGHRPLRWCVQTQHALAATGMQRIYHPVMIGGEGKLRFDVIERNDGFIAKHVARCERVWNEVLLHRGTPIAAREQ